MRSDALQNWRREREAVEQEMDRLITEGLPASVEDRQVRQTRFVALVERREAAARKLLQSDWASRRDTSPRASDVVAIAPEVADISAASAAGLIVDVPAGAAELPAEVVTPDAAASASVPAVGVPAATAGPPTDDIVALAPDVAEAALFARSVAVPTASTHSAGAVANPVDAAPLATHAKTTSSDDHDASLLALLRRLQSWRSSTT
jgi:hypothetical protein